MQRSENSRKQVSGKKFHFLFFIIFSLLILLGVAFILYCFKIMMQRSVYRNKQVSGKLERMINYRIFMANLK